jgi:hypothetical protein
MTDTFHLSQLAVALDMLKIVQMYNRKDHFLQPSQAPLKQPLCGLVQLLNALQWQIRPMRVTVSHSLYAGQTTLSATDHYFN